MARQVKIWFDRELDFLEVTFSDQEGYMRETANDAVMERVSADGKLLGFTIMNVCASTHEKPLVAELLAEAG